MQIHSYTVLHYGADYLPYALRSVAGALDRLHVLYTPHPTHGSRTDARPPESESELFFAATAWDAGHKVNYIKVEHVWQEGPQRDMALGVCRAGGADLALVVDCDEVWPAATLWAALAYAWAQNKARNWLVNMTTLWRSFNWVCRDDMWPVRIVDFRHEEGVAYLPRELGPVYHFGYAVRDRIQRYKWQIHGHIGELRPGWFEEKWAAWPPAPDCHPTCERMWNPEPFDKNELPGLMREHPFWELEKIE